MKKQTPVDDYDFGFSFVDEDYEDVKQVNSKLSQETASNQETIDDLKSRLDQLYNAIIPFLNNLTKNPEKSTIHWPNRAEKIEEFKAKLDKIANG